MDLILNYLHEMRLTHATGSNTVETSFYGPLERLLNEVGKTLKPRVRAVAQLRNRGTGQPDFGLYSADQFQRAAAGDPLPGQQPSRGVVEVKGTSADVLRVAQDDQVRRYLRGFGQVLVTNYRDFLLVVLDANGNAVQLERYQLASDEAAFWTDDPARLAETRGPGLIEYLRRVLLAEQSGGCCLVPGLVCPRCARQGRAGGCAGAGADARGAGAGSGDCFSGRAGAALLPLDADPDAILWHLLGLGALAR